MPYNTVLHLRAISNAQVLSIGCVVTEAGVTEPRAKNEDAVEILLAGRKRPVPAAPLAVCIRRYFPTSHFKALRHWTPVSLRLELKTRQTPQTVTRALRGSVAGHWSLDSAAPGAEKQSPRL